MKRIAVLLICLIVSGVSFGQETPIEKVSFIIGDWTGTGSGFGNSTSNIESSFQYIMDGKYIEVINESQFEPTDKNLNGEYIIDKGFISFDKQKKVFVFRQFNNEGYVNQYVLNDSLSNDSILVFETETIENFVPKGKQNGPLGKLKKMK